MAIDPKPKKVTKKIMVKVPKSSEADSGDIELTQKYATSKKKMEKSLSKEKSDTIYDKAQGINIEKKTMQATPKVFVRKVIKTGNEYGNTKILSDDGKSVKYEGKTSAKATQDALRENIIHSKDTNKRRDYNSNFYNVNSGAKTELDGDDKEMLMGLQKAVPKKK